MFRDLAFKSSRKITCDPKKFVPLFIAGHDIDNDKIEELVIFGECGDMIVYKVCNIYICFSCDRL
jgi:hypothetical protein